MKLKLQPKKGGMSKRPPKLKLKASVARARRAPIIEEEEDYFDEPEPNMKLSHAFVVVLVLHVIAVAGVFAFNTIKTKQDDILAVTKENPDPAAETAGGSPALTAAGSQPAAAPANVVQPPAPATEPGSHVIMAGETLTSVAAKYGVTVAALQAANSIEDPTKIRVGTTLAIPSPEAAAQPAPPAARKVAQAESPASSQPVTKAPETSAPVKAAAEAKVYEVVKGDNPVTIAKKFHVSEAALMEANGIADPRKLQIGQKLKIPAK